MQLLFLSLVFFFNDTATTEIYTLSLHDALPIYIDFLTEDKIILEIKNSSKFYPKDIKQALGYLKAKNKELGILACFGKNGLIHKRILKGN